MKAMIFAAGLGSRLKPLTNTTPKALVMVAGKPLLQHTIEKLILSGFNEIIINVHHFADQIIDFIKLKNSFDIKIEISDERNILLDTGGGIKNASHFFDDGNPFLIHNVDIISDIDLKDLYNFHIKSGASVTLVCSERKTSRYFLFNKDNYLKGWINEKTNEIKSPIVDFEFSRFRKLAFSGIHIINPSVFKFLSDFTEKFSIVDFYLSICNTEQVIAYVPDNLRMIDVGKPDSLKKASSFFIK